MRDESESKSLYKSALPSRSIRNHAVEAQKAPNGRRGVWCCLGPGNRQVAQLLRVVTNTLGLRHSTPGKRDPIDKHNACRNETERPPFLQQHAQVAVKISWSASGSLPASAEPRAVGTTMGRQGKWGGGGTC